MTPRPRDDKNQENLLSAHPSPHRIDTHHHIMPPAFLAKGGERVIAVAPGMRDLVQEWSPERAVETMDANGIAIAITSISTPGVWLDGVAAARTLARECNDYAARMATDYPGRFGLFAALPLPDVDGSLKEIEYAYAELKADGIGLMTNYDDTWPGELAWAPVFDELNRRKAIVYFHPTAAACCTNLIPGVHPAILEFPNDTARAVTSLLASGTLERCPDIRFIFSHGGGTLPMLVHRLNGLLRTRKDLELRLPDGVPPVLRRLHYDIVGTAHSIAFGAVREMAGISQLLFGSDYPYWTPDVTLAALAGLGLSTADRRAIERDNALRLFPRLNR